MSYTTPFRKEDPDSNGVVFRKRALAAAPGELDIEPSDQFPSVFSVLMDWPVSGMVATIMSICDGSASLYTTTTLSVVGGGSHEAVRAAAIRFTSEAGRHYHSALPVTDCPYPLPGTVYFYLVCFDGVRLIEVQEAALDRPDHRYARLWNAAQDVFSELRKVAAQYGHSG